MGAGGRGPDVRAGGRGSDNPNAHFKYASIEAF